MVVARPAGVYQSHVINGKVWLPEAKTATGNRQPRDYLANRNGPETRLAPRPGPTDGTKGPRHG